jgi:WD40 repeat protein
MPRLRLRTAAPPKHHGEIRWLGFEAGTGLPFLVDGVAVLWVFDRSGESLRRVRLPAVPDQVEAFSGEEGPSYLCSGGGMAWLVRTPPAVSSEARADGRGTTAGEQWVQLVPCPERVGAAAATPDGQTLAFALGDGRVTALPLAALEPVPLKRHGSGTDVTRVLLTHGGDKLFTVSADGLALFGPLRGETEWKGQVVGDFSALSPPLTADTSGDGRRIVYRSSRGRFAIIDSDVPDAGFASFADEGLFPSLVPVGLDPVRPRIAFAVRRQTGTNVLARENTLRIWDYARRMAVAVWELEARVAALAYSPDGRWLASAGGGTVRLWQGDATEDQPVRKWTVPGPVACLAFSPDGEALAVGTDGGRVYVWPTRREGRTASAALHRSPVRGVAFFPGGHLLASGSTDGTVKLWDVAEPMERCTLRAGGGVHSLAVSPRGDYIAAGCDRGAVRLFQAADDAALREAFRRAAEQSPQDAESWRDLALACWADFLRHRAASHVRAARAALEEGLDACARLRGLSAHPGEAGHWADAFGEQLQKSVD